MLGALIVLSITTAVLSIVVFVCLLRISDDRSEGSHARRQLGHALGELRVKDKAVGIEKRRANHHRERCRKLRVKVRELEDQMANWAASELPK